MCEKLWLAVRRDHDGNLDVLKKEDGISFAYNLNSEEEAKAIIAHTTRAHTKVHGQEYWPMCYKPGTLKSFLREHRIRV